MQGRSLWRFLTPLAYFFPPLLSSTPLSFFSVSRLRLLGLGICFLRPCCNYRGAPLPLLPLAPSPLFLSLLIGGKKLYWGHLNPTTGFCAASTPGTHRTDSFTSPNLYRSRESPGWPPHANGTATRGVEHLQRGDGAGFPRVSAKQTVEKQVEKRSGRQAVFTFIKDVMLCVTCSFVGWLVGWLIGWFVGWLVGWFIKQTSTVVGSKRNGSIFMCSL